ncbi:hypothetical protein RB3647 [Rhodopirellula baltica SH 1]|uniref:Uncharacterized protein n=1 Tax=Rhodopirellula baltica (strain DSM 10527 / NCIMB 13988 / SH1) TaxID=243090 RepID=Q7UTW7_RHOBA|nr:hypothetical protein RB3647 [Rhodopirellula baltica SH 1]
MCGGVLVRSYPDNLIQCLQDSLRLSETNQAFRNGHAQLARPKFCEFESGQ